MSEYEDVEVGGFHKWDEIGDVIEGVIRYISPDGGTDFNDNPCPEVGFLTDYGTVRLTCGQAQLKMAFTSGDPKLQVGHKARIEWVGEKDTGKGNPAKQFKIQATPEVVMADVATYTPAEEPF